MKQAESASRAAETLMTASAQESGDSNDVNELKEALEKAKIEAESAKKDVKSMKSQSESLAEEYDRLVCFIMVLCTELLPLQADGGEGQVGEEGQHHWGRRKER